MNDDWPIFHFSLGNSLGPDQGNVSALLRSLADNIDTKGAIDVIDITFSNKPTVHGDDLTMTVYYAR